MKSLKIELCVINRIRERVVTFARVDCSETAEDTIRMDVGEQQVGMFQAVQQQVLTPAVPVAMEEALQRQDIYS